MASIQPQENADKYPEPTMFGDLPATGIYARHVKNLELTNVEIATESADARSAFYLDDVNGADFFRLKLPARTDQFRLKDVSDFRLFGCQHYPDTTEANAENKTI